MAIAIDGDGIGVSALSTTAKAELKSGRKNLIINGGMQVAQRGTQAVGGSTGLHYGGCDRWRVYQENTATAYTLSQDSNAPSGFASSLKVDITTADATADAADRIDLLYRFEGQDFQQLAKGTSDAKQMSLSFWVSSPKTGTHIVELYDTDNNRQVSASYTISTADTWEKKIIAVPADTAGALTNDNNLSLQVAWWLLAGSNYSSGTLNTSWAASTSANRAVGQVNVVDSTANNFYITGVQLELGDTATDFEHRSYGEELALCQRYYHHTNAHGNYMFSVQGTRWGTSHYSTYFFPTEMRVKPTLSYSGADALMSFASNTAYASTAISLGDGGGHSLEINVTSSQAEDSAFIRHNAASAYLAFDAEL